MALATLVRIWVLPLGLVFMIGYWLRFRNWRFVILYAVIIASIIAIWPALRWTSSGEFAMASSKVSTAGHLAWNLDVRRRIMIQNLPKDDESEEPQAPMDPHTTVSAELSRFILFSLSHPISFLREVTQDTFVYVAQSGIERVTIDYLELAGPARREIQEFLAGWRLMLYQRGILETAGYLMAFGWVFTLSIIGVIATLILWALAALGTFAAIKTMPRQVGLPRALILLSLAAFACVAFLPGILLIFPQVRYRSPAEFGLSILAVLGARWFFLFIRERETLRMP
jgi:hypothetical protein